MKRYKKNSSTNNDAVNQKEMEWNDEVMYRVMIGILAVALLAAAVLYFVPELRVAFQSRPCVLRSMTGLYCPGCGGTRALLYFLNGQIIKSFYYNAAVGYGISFVLIYMISHTLKHVTKGKIRGIHYRNRYCYIGLGLFIINWGWKNYMLLVHQKMLIP